MYFLGFWRYEPECEICWERRKVAGDKSFYICPRIQPHTLMCLAKGFGQGNKVMNGAIECFLIAEKNEEHGYLG
jgi:hypothetical protein